jgi:general secretion pathway protein D
LAACDSLAGLGGGPSATVGGDPPPGLGAAASIQQGRREPSRAVAVVPAGRMPEAPLPAVVVRGRESSGTPPVPQHGSSVEKTGDVTLNFAGADIRDVVGQVLGETLKLNFVIDPEVSGPVNFNVSRPLAREEILPTLEAVLNSRGATMVQVNGIVRVMPMRKDGKSGAAAPMARGPGQAIGERTQVFELRFVGATDMQRVLEKVLPPGQVITPNDQRHLLVVQGSPSELQLAQDTIRVFDVDQLTGMSMALVPLSNADPSAIAGELKNIFAATRKDAESDAIRVMAVTRLNAVMVITRAPHYLDEARAWISRLDRNRNLNERRVYVYNLQYSKAAQVGQKLQGLLSGLDIQFRASGMPSPEGIGAPGTDSGQPGSAAKAPDAKPPAAEPVVPLPVSAPAVPDTAVAERSSVRIEADEAHNALLISASARDYDLIRQVLQGIDVPPLQVLIEVTVAEVTLNDKLNYGVEYFINSGNFNALLTTGSSALGVVAPAPGFALSWFTGKFQPRAILDALSAVTETKVISTPRLLVLSNQTARLQVGDVVPIITQSATSTITSNPLVLNNVTYKETGVVLEVTPRVNSGGYVTMDVNQSVSDVVNTTTSTIDSPTIRQRRLTSTISVKSGESILLGGLIQQQSNRVASGIPVLNELPGIGALFGTRNSSAGRTELIMLMTPRVISNEDAARDMTAKVEREFQAVLDANAMPRPRRPMR